MTFAFQSAGHHHAVGTVLKGIKDKLNIEFASARQLNDPDTWWVLDAQCTRQIRRRISAVVAAKGNDPLLEAIVRTHTNPPICQTS
jgi:hypothetical protein